MSHDPGCKATGRLFQVGRRLSVFGDAKGERADDALPVLAVDAAVVAERQEDSLWQRQRKQLAAGGAKAGSDRQIAVIAMTMKRAACNAKIMATDFPVGLCRLVASWHAVTQRQGDSPPASLHADSATARFFGSGR